MAFYSESQVVEVRVRYILVFNALELHQCSNFRDIGLDYPEQVPAQVRRLLTGVTDQALKASQPHSFKCGAERAVPASEAPTILNAEYNFNNKCFCFVFLMGGCPSFIEE